MVSNLIAVAAVLYGIYVGYTGQTGEGIDLQSGLQVLASVLGGSAFLGYNNWSTVLALVSPKKNSDPTQQVFTPENFEQKDFECLVHLRNRLQATGSVEGVKVVSQLNDIIFKLNAKVEGTKNA